MTPNVKENNEHSRELGLPSSSFLHRATHVFSVLSKHLQTLLLILPVILIDVDVLILGMTIAVCLIHHSTVSRWGWMNEWRFGGCEWAETHSKWITKISSSSNHSVSPSHQGTDRQRWSLGRALYWSAVAQISKEGKNLYYGAAFIHS